MPPSAAPSCPPCAPDPPSHLGARIALRLRQAWQGRGLLACLLWPLAQLYGALVVLRRLAYRRGWLSSHRLPVPVVVVGNVVVGGAGKTPVTLALLAHLQARGWRPGVISRGYGRNTATSGQPQCLPVLPDSPASAVGDEPALIARRTGVPVFVASQRAEAARALLAAHPDTTLLVCDDGLQHLALQRDVEIAVFNSDGIGNGWLLPAGPLREPWPRSLDMLLHSGPAPAGGSAPRFALTRRLADYAVNAQGQRTPLALLRGQALYALAGTARPEEFFAMLAQHGLQLAQRQALPDHFDFDSWKRLPKKGFTLICTEKDAVKLWPHEPDALAVPLELDIAPGFFAALDARLANLPPPPTDRSPL